MSDHVPQTLCRFHNLNKNYESTSIMGDTTAAELEMEQLEEEDILDFLHSKGSSLDAFRREYLDLQKVFESLKHCLQY